MGDQQIMFFVTMFIVIISASAAPGDPSNVLTVTCSGSEIKINISNYTTPSPISELIYFDRSLNLKIENVKEKMGSIDIHRDNLRLEGTIYVMSFYLTTTKKNKEGDSIVTINEKKFTVECDFLNRGKSVGVIITKFMAVPIVNPVDLRLMTIKPDMKIGETSTITVDMTRYTKGVIKSCYIQDMHDDENDMSKAYIIYHHCDKSVGSMYIKNEEFDDKTKMVTAQLTGIGLSGTEEVRIMCFMVGCISDDQCEEFDKRYKPCPP